MRPVWKENRYMTPEEMETEARELMLQGYH